MTEINRSSRVSSTSRTGRTGNSRRVNSNRTGSLFSNSSKSGSTPSAEKIAKSLKDDIYATKWGVPTTGDDIGKHVRQVNSSNVRQVINSYLELTGSKESLFSAILDEYGLSTSERESYVKHIFYARIESAKKEGIYVDDIKKDFDTELNKKGLISKKFVNALYSNLIKRTKTVSSNAGQVKDKANGKIDKDFKQGKTGDCWLLAGIEALANSPKGLKILNESLRLLPNGAVEVTLKGVNKKYVISQAEINNARELSTGDADVRAIEIAMNKYFKEVGGVRGQVDINGNKSHVLFNAITGKGGKNFFEDSYGRILDYNLSDSQINNFNKSNHIAVVSASGKGSETFAAPEGNGTIKLYKNHAYTVKGSDANNVYLINPHNTSKVITISRKDFKEFFNRIDEFDL